MCVCLMRVFTVTLAVGVSSADPLGMLCRRTPLSGTSGTQRIMGVSHVGSTAVTMVTGTDRVAMVTRSS